MENPVVEKDILDLAAKISQFRDGRLPDDKFKSIRLARGIYGQRQKGVQMVRIKLPHGKMTFAQWKRIADVSDEYATSNLHLTTRQDIQIHFVSLDRTPELWEKLSKDDVTIREACGNTVRNITGSAIAGIDPDEPFDITPYAEATFRYFLRKPVNQEMGRKFKISFSSSDKDSAWAFIHDVGLIAKVKVVDGKEVRGFKVLVGGGLGAQPVLAKPVFDFLEEDLLIPYIETVLRVFDRYGERTNRNKARMKYLINKIGIDEFNRRIAEEQQAITYKRYKINTEEFTPEVKLPQVTVSLPGFQINDPKQFEAWKKTNTFVQKQSAYYAAFVKIPQGNIGSGIARQLMDKLKPVVADDVRVTPNQGLLFKYIQPVHLPYVYSVLEQAGLGEPGFDSVGDITACPGTDTCNLGISNSTGIAAALEKVIREEYPDLIHNNDIKIKISGCMNSCGQHGIANIGFHGSSLKSNGKTLPALQLLLGGGIVGNGAGRIADKVIKIPSKKGPDALRILLDDYHDNALEGEYFNDYYDRQGNKYFYNILKPVTDLTTLVAEDFIDWGQEKNYETVIGVGECAGVIIDLVTVLLLDAEEKLQKAEEALIGQQFADSIYFSYASFIHGAKALLLGEEVLCNTQIGIINDFQKHFISTGKFSSITDFSSVVLQINQHEPGEEFALRYYQQANAFMEGVKEFSSKRTMEKTIPETAG